MIRIRTMTLADLPAAMRLKTQALWNQTAADWRRFLAMQPDGCFVAEQSGGVVATAVACAFGPVAWLAMVLVDGSLRGRGIGTALVRHALAHLDQTGVRSVRLDATPLGQPLYEKLGFEPEYVLQRYEGVLPPASGNWPRHEPSATRAARPEDYPLLCEFDSTIAGADRSKFLVRLFREQPDALRWMGEPSEAAGYATVRLGSDALQLGPCAANGDAGGILLTDAARRHAGKRAVLDVPLTNVAAVALAERLGLEPRRRLQRMFRGLAVGGDATMMWASSGPELG
jgi:ribosomal protein S18 acetylase RimI-like enzyme